MSKVPNNYSAFQKSKKAKIIVTESDGTVLNFNNKQEYEDWMYNQDQDKKNINPRR